MLLNPLTLFAIITISFLSTIILIFGVMILRIVRTTTLEQRIVQHASAINTAQLQIYLQNLSINPVEIDAEVEALKADIIKAAHKHQLTVDKDDTQTDSPFNTPQKREQLLKIVQHQKGKKAKVS